MSIPVYNEQEIPVITLRPDWVRPLKWSQQYSTTISEALDTSEERQTRFPRPLYRLSYTTLGLSASETSYLRTIIETADDLPVACPLWPLAVPLATDVAAGETTIVFEDANDCLFDVFHEFALVWETFDHWEIVELSFVIPESAGFVAPLQNSYSTEALFLPLAYGLVPRGPVTQLTDANGRWNCRFEETFHRLHDQSLVETGVLFDPRPCNVTALENGGGDTFDCYYDGSTSALPLAGTGFIGKWLISNSPFAYVLGDTFDSYGDGTFTGKNSGEGWASAWRCSDSPFGNPLGDTFDSYPDGNNLSDLNSGSGFLGDWLCG